MGWEGKKRSCTDFLSSITSTTYKCSWDQFCKTIATVNWFWWSYNAQQSIHTWLISTYIHTIFSYSNFMLWHIHNTSHSLTCIHRNLFKSYFDYTMKNNKQQVATAAIRMRNKIHWMQIFVLVLSIFGSLHKLSMEML